MSHFLWQSSVFVCLVLVMGCGQSGPTRYPLNGAVTLDGQPVTVGFLMFEPSQGATGVVAPTASGRVVDGKYHFSSSDGPGKGSYQVRLSPPEAESGTANPPKTFPVQTTAVNVPDGGGVLDLQFQQPSGSGKK